MRYYELFENADQDISYNKEAKQFLSDIIDYCQTVSPQHIKIYKISGENFIVLDDISDDIKILINRNNTKSSTHGRYGILKSGKPYIKITFVGDEPVERKDIKNIFNKIIFDEWTQKMILHEYIHYLDSFRIKTMSKNIVDATDKEKYYNNPIEFNAYYHNVADNLMSFIHQAEYLNSREQIKDLMNYYGVKENFTETLNEILKNDFSDFMEKLNQRNKRAIYKRLYTLYKKAIDLTI